jgi:uncharacterized membrane protein YfcA
MRRLLMSFVIGASVLTVPGAAYAQGPRNQPTDGTRAVLVLSGAALGAFAVSALAPVAWATTPYIIGGGVLGGVIGNWVSSSSNQSEFVKRASVTIEVEAPSLFHLATMAD